MYSFTSRVRYSEVDASKQLDLHSILNYFQDCSIFHSEDIHIGLKELADQNLAWILSGWQINVFRYPTLGETITTGTWAYEFNLLYGNRNFIMKDQQGEVLAVANSTWILMDTLNKRPVKVNTIDIDKYIMEEKYPMDYAPRKIALPKTYTIHDSFSIIKRNIDTNNHVNNGEYIKMAQEYLPEDFTIYQMRAEYKRSAVLGDVILPLVFVDGDICLVVLADTNQKPYAIVEFTRAHNINQ